MRTRPSRSGRADDRVARPAYAALTWIVVFFAFHVYWYAGGTFGRGGVLPGLLPHSVIGWIFEVAIVAAFPIGAWACLAIARGWPRGGLRGLATFLVWFGCALLTLRGVSGLVDDLTRAIGLLPEGITGLSIREATGMAHPSSSVLWSGRATDAYFFAGGLVFGRLAWRRHRNPPDIAPTSGG